MHVMQMNTGELAVRRRSPPFSIKLFLTACFGYILIPFGPLHEPKTPRTPPAPNLDKATADDRSLRLESSLLCHLPHFPLFFQLFQPLLLFFAQVGPLRLFLGEPLLFG